MNGDKNNHAHNGGGPKNNGNRKGNIKNPQNRRNESKTTNSGKGESQDKKDERIANEGKVSQNTTKINNNKNDKGKQKKQDKKDDDHRNSVDRRNGNRENCSGGQYQRNGRGNNGNNNQRNNSKQGSNQSGPDGPQNHSSTPRIEPKLLQFCKSLRSKIDARSSTTSLLPSDAKAFKTAFQLAVYDETEREFILFRESLLQTYLNVAETEAFAPTAEHVILLMSKYVSTSNPTVKEIDLVKDVVASRLNRSTSMKTICSREDREATIIAFTSLTSQIISSRQLIQFPTLMQQWPKISIEYLQALASYEPIIPNLPDTVVSWNQNPTVGWLLGLSRSPPKELCEQYDSIEAYSQTLTSLWTYMTFYWGIGAMWPKCSHFSGPGSGNQAPGTQQRCGNPMLKCLSAPKRCTMHIIRDGKQEMCDQVSMWSCFRDHHDSICEDCLYGKQQSLLGPGGPKRHDASTDIYDAEIASVAIKSEATTLLLKDISSRKPPAVDVNWRTSYRLQPAGLVAVVSLPSPNVGLQSNMRIFLGEIVTHDAKAKDEYLRRQKKYLDVRLLCRTDAAVLDSGYETPFIPKGHVAIIDMRVFTPQVISVLGTLCDPSFGHGLARVPFREAFRGIVNPLPPISNDWNGELLTLIGEAMQRSNIRAFHLISPVDKQEFARNLCEMPVIRSLDRTQRMAFIYGLTCDVHVTQGPPGTGKSYVGVCLVLAFIKLKRMLKNQGRDVGPILSLSYKNHALDEFLLDCKHYDPSLHEKGKLIRLGKPESSALLNFTEKNSAIETKAQNELDRRIGVMKQLKILLSKWKSTFGIVVDNHDLAKELVRGLELLKDVYYVLEAEEEEYEDEEEYDAELFEILVYFVSPKVANGWMQILPDPLLLQTSSHWTEVKGDLGKMVLKWILGESPPPRCHFTFRKGNVCEKYAVEGFDYCINHKCGDENCENNISSKRRFCAKHCCQHNACVNQALYDSTWCVQHACSICGNQSRFSDKHDACKKHLCHKSQCSKAALYPLLFCIDHTCSICREIDQISETSSLVVNSGENPTRKFCGSHKCKMQGCCNARQALMPPYCVVHTCQLCDQMVDDTVNTSSYCSDHRCRFVDYEADEYCVKARIQVGRRRVSSFCASHTCVGCVEAGKDLTELAYGPRFTCLDHPMCTEILETGELCPFLATQNSGNTFCTYHEQQGSTVVFNYDTCCGIKPKDKKRCKNANRPSNFPKGQPWFCRAHEDQQKSFHPPSTTNPSTTQEPLILKDAPSLGGYSLVQANKSEVSKSLHACFALPSNGTQSFYSVLQCTECTKLGTSDTIFRISNGASLLCMIDQRKLRKKDILSSKTSSSVESLGTMTAAAASVVPSESSNSSLDRNPVLVQPKERAVAASSQAAAPRRPVQFAHYEDDNIVDTGAYGGADNPDELDVDPNYTNEEFRNDTVGDDDDELHVNETVEHNREIYQEDNDEAEEDEGFDHTDLDEEDRVYAQMGMKLVEPDKLLEIVNAWTWDMPLDQRLHQAHIVIFSCMKLLAHYMAIAEKHVEQARREKSEATAIALKKATLVGGTVVGVAKRLAALRAAEPFVIIVEEACEVMEPTLVAVLAVESVQKLELVGDHMQLPAFVDQCWFNIESTIPSIKRSLFERLVKRGGGIVRDDKPGYGRSRQTISEPIAAQEASLHTILDVQRRMTPNIADLTRKEYEHIIPILDHVKTETQVIGDKLLHNVEFEETRFLWHNPHAPPGVKSNIFFWNMVNNATSRPKVGLSACNENEAIAVAQLVEYFLLCGVPPACITVITPYQGQKREIIAVMRQRKILPRRLPTFGEDEDTVLVSTVDRYQGDENDIVILSLVRAQAGNRFVTFANRFIVAASRARLGFYVIGSVEAVVPQDKQGPPHWKRFVQHLQEQQQVGDHLELCCPCHSTSNTLQISSQYDKTHLRQFPTTKTWFCQAKCTTPLNNCGHSCELPCHYPTALKHRAKCLVRIPRPCNIHSEVPLLCGDSNRENGAFRCELEDDYHRDDCGIHTMRLTCAKYQDYTGGRVAWPRCNELMGPFIHPDCGHPFADVNCYTYRSYEANPPQCRTKIEISLPNCPHKLSTECWKQSQFARGDFACQEVVKIRRPRCQHEAQTRCVIAQKLQAREEEWQHEPHNPQYLHHHQALVLDATQRYGPKEQRIVSEFSAICWEKVSIKRSCGHILRNIPCQKAYELVANPHSMDPCKDKRSFRCPLCSSNIEITCSKYDEVLDVDLSTVILECLVEEPRFLETKQKIFFSSALQQQLGTISNQTKCSTLVKLRRSCHPTHLQQITCHELLLLLLGKRNLNECGQDMTFMRNDCGHNITIPCNLRTRLPRCRELIQQFYRDPRCGCQSVINQCGDWMALQRDPALRECDQRVQTNFIRCGHSMDIFCNRRELVEQPAIRGVCFPPVDEGDNQQIQINENQLYCLPCVDAPPCSKPVSFVRGLCGHIVENVPCTQAFTWTRPHPEKSKVRPPPCQEMFSLTKHPVCGVHEARWLCHIYEILQTWNPWEIFEELEFPGLDFAPMVVSIDEITNTKRDVLVIDGETLENLSYLNVALPSSISWDHIACRESLYIQMPNCQHLRTYQCHDFFIKAQKQQLQCEELVIHKCHRCHLTRSITCWEQQTKRFDQIDRECTSCISQTCMHCHVNVVEVTCSTADVVECKRKVTQQLPCGHEISWLCQPNHVSIARAHDTLTNFNPQCIECCILSWEQLTVVRLTIEQIQRIVDERIAFMQHEDGLYDGITVKRETWLDISEAVLDDFHAEIETHVYKVIQAMRHSKHPIVPPPLRSNRQFRRPSTQQLQSSSVSSATAAVIESSTVTITDLSMLWTQYLIDHLLDVVFIANAPNKPANPLNVSHRFCLKPTAYGRGVSLKGVSSTSVRNVLTEVNQTTAISAGRESVTDFWIALVYRGSVLVPSQAKSIFLSNAKNHENLLMKNAQDQGYSGVLVSSNPNHPITKNGADLSDIDMIHQELWETLQTSRQLYEHIVWYPNHIIPTSIITLSLQAECGVCLELFVRHHDCGTWCEDGHFVCWDCLKGYVKSADTVDTMTKPTAKGQLPCYDRNCTHAYDLLKLGSSNAPPTVFEAIQQYELHLKIAQASERIRQEEKQRHEQDMKRMMELSNHERQVEYLIREIHERILPLRCPSCDRVWVDFDACCEVTCICQTTFCAWCIQPGTHVHVVRCQLNPIQGEVYGSKANLKRVHNQQRVTKVERRLRQERDNNIVRDVLLKLQIDFEDLGMHYPNMPRS